MKWIQPFLKSPKQLVLTGLAVAIVYSMASHALNQSFDQTLQSHLNKGEYDIAIELLQKKTQSSWLSRYPNQLAYLLTTTPNLKLRNYSQAIELSTYAKDHAFQAEERWLAKDTLACALFANREEEAAKKFAIENGLNKRAKQFAVGKPCRSIEPARDVASE